MSPSSHDIVLTSSPEGLITAYDSFSGSVVARFTGSRSPRHGLTLLGNTFIAASHISSSTGSTSVHLYNWWSSTALHRLPLPEPVAPLAASPDGGSYIFAGGLSGNIHSLSAPSGNLVRSIPAHRGSPVSCLEICPDWSLLISGGDNGTIAVLQIFQLLDDSPSPEEIEIQRFTAHEGPVTSIVRCMGLCQPTVVSCSMDCTCKVWSIMEGTNLRTVAFPCPISGIALDPSETDLYAAGSDGVVYQVALKVENRKPGKLIALSGKHSALIVSIGLVGGGKSLVSAAEDGSVHLRDVETGEVTTLMGNNMVSISEMVVAKGFGDGRTSRLNGLGQTYHGSSSGLPGKDECALLGKETRRLDKAVKDDRNKAIDMLESAIEVYESLVELILKEANRD